MCVMGKRENADSTGEKDKLNECRQKGEDESIRITIEGGWKKGQEGRERNVK